MGVSKTKLIITSIIIVLGSIGVISGMDKDNNIAKQVNNQVTPTEDQPPVNVSDAQTKEAVVGTEVSPTSTTTTPETIAPDTQKTTIVPFDPVEYSHKLLTEKAEQGIPGTNVKCFDSLMSEANSWKLTKIDVDNVVNHIFAQYTSTCSAYYQFQQTGEY